MTTTQIGTDSRNDRTRNALLWLGHVIANYMGGDWDHEDMARELATATWHGLSDDFGPAARRLDTALALNALQKALAEEVVTQVKLAKTEDDGVTWQKIADVFGMNSRQAAEMRFGK